MIIPNFLQAGDVVGIVSTARKITRNELLPAIHTFKSWGLKIFLGKNLYSEDNQFAGNDNQRLNDLQSMLDNKKVKAIICARGGYGTVRIIDSLDFSIFKKQPKWIVGYSDVTVLHLHLNNLGFATLHSTMPINFQDNTKKSLNSLKNALFGTNRSISYKSNKACKDAIISGKLVGGNLSIIYSILGTNSDIDTKEKILFLEDIDEYLYHIDRMIVSLKRNGKLKYLKALIVGSFTNIKDNEIPFGSTVEEIIKHHTNEYNYPICFDFPSGHIKDNQSLIFGAETCININSNNVILQQTQELE
tara:strand:- start:977 stop:1885 length:909 start_codon:yes stop_codon:yes gene_type:complete